MIGRNRSVSADRTLLLMSPTSEPQALIYKPNVTPSFKRHAQPGSIDHLLSTIRAYLKKEVAFVAHLSSGEIKVQNISGSASMFVVGDTLAAESYCKRILDGRIPYLLSDTATLPEVAELAYTKEMPIGSYISVPIILSDGSAYGTFCCFGSEADDSLSGHDLQIMHAFAAVAAGQLEREIADGKIRHETVDRIYSAIHDESLTIVYQPIYELETHVPVGVECLARFPDGVLRPPSEWFSEAVEVGLGVDLEMAAIQAALRGISSLPADIYLSVNASPDTILSGRLEEALRDIPRNRLVIEVTEHAVVSDYDELRRALEPLRGLVRIAVDDAGAGNAGFRQIVDVAPDIIKLDMSLTRGIDSDTRRASLASALVSFAHEIDSIIVAEGIETGAELATLRQLGVQCGQGYLLSPPFPIAHITSFLSEAGLQTAQSSS